MLALTGKDIHTHNSLTTQTHIVCSTLMESEIASPKTRELTTHTSRSQLTLTMCGCPLVFAAQYGCSRPSYLPIFV